MPNPEVAPKVLIVCNRQTTGPLWVFSLQKLLQVELEIDPSNAIQRCEMENPDLIILDISLSDAKILELVRGLRAQILSPIILLTPPRSEEFMIDVYNSGVDDCLLKPTSPSIFHAKVRVWLRRSWSQSTGTLEPVKAGGMQLFPAQRMILLANGKSVYLTNPELRLMYYLMNHANYALTAEELNQRVWGYTPDADSTTLKDTIHKLRHKIEVNPIKPLVIQTVDETGYKLAVG